MPIWKIAMLFLLSRTAPVKSFGVLKRRSSRHSSLFSTTSSSSSDLQVLNLLSIEKQDLEHHVVSWGHPKYRADQVWNWIRQGVTDVKDMTNLPNKLRADLEQYTKLGALTLDTELVSKDGTRKRAYRLWDGQLIESVLMPYQDGRYTACISSQAGCAMGCVFCATGQMGFRRQLTPEEIFEQVARFDAELAAQNHRLSNIVFMGMGEPLANYRNVVAAVKRITQDLGIGARKITISTVGVVPNIRKLMTDPDMPQVRLAVSLHCASDEERTQLLPANGRYGGLDELMMTLKEYIDTTKKRITLEWALIEEQNDNPETARQLGNLVKRFGIRKDMVHVNVIPLNPTGGYGGSPSGRNRVNAFCSTLVDEFGISCTPRVRRGIDINAGCGQLTSDLEKKKLEEAENRKSEEAVVESIGHDHMALADFIKSPSPQAPMAGVYEDDFDDSEENDSVGTFEVKADFIVDDNAIDFDCDDYEDPEFSTEWELKEAERLIALVQQGTLQAAAFENDVQTPTTSITDDDSLQEAKRKRKKLIKNLKAVDRLRERQQQLNFEFNEEQLAKLNQEADWRAQLESVEHNLK